MARGDWRSSIGRSEGGVGLRQGMERLLARLREPWTTAVGLAMQDGTLCLACLERTGPPWHVKETLHLPLPASEADNPPWQEAAEVVKVALFKRGWEKSRIAVCLAQEQVFFYSKDFPPLSEREMKEAARWDLLASLPAAEEERAYSLGFKRVGEREVVLAALPREKARAIHRAFSEAGLCLASLCFLLPAPGDAGAAAEPAADGAPLAPAQSGQEDDAAAFLAAQGLLGQEEEHIELLPEELRPAEWAFGRIAALFAAVFFFCLASLYTWNAWQIHALRQELQEVSQEMALLSPERVRMERDAQEEGRTVLKEEKLLSLSEGAVPCRSLLVHFGAHTVEGVWIRDLRVVDGHVVEVGGAATSYDALAEFVRSLEADEAFFKAAPVLRSSERRKETAGDTLVYFSLELKI